MLELRCIFGNASLSNKAGKSRKPIFRLLLQKYHLTFLAHHLLHCWHITLSTKFNQVIFRVQRVLCLYRRCCCYPLSTSYICIYLNISLQLLPPRAGLYKYIYVD